MIKLLIDENIPFRLIAALNSNGFNVKSVVEEMKSANDHDILRFALAENRILLTLDKEFASLVYRTKKENSGLILIRLRNYGYENILDYLLKLFKKFKKSILQKSFVVISENNIRIRSF